MYVRCWYENNARCPSITSNVHEQSLGYYCELTGFIQDEIYQMANFTLEQLNEVMRKRLVRAQSQRRQPVVPNYKMYGKLSTGCELVASSGTRETILKDPMQR